MRELDLRSSRLRGKDSADGLEPLTIPDILRYSAQRFGERIALQIERGGGYYSLTYSELLRQSENLMLHLTKEGFIPGQRGAILAESRPEWAVALFGILMSGGVVVPIDTKIHERGIEKILAHCEAGLLFTSSSFEGKSTLKKVISLDSDEFTTAALCDGEADPVRCHPDDLAMLVYTSGTTGSPKAVMLTHNNIVSNVIAASAAVPATPSDSFLSILPLNHLLELTGGLLGPLHSGATVTYMKQIDTAAIRKTMKETETTVMLGVPLFFKVMLKRILDRIDESIQPIPFIFSFNMKMARASRRLRIGRLLLRQIRAQFGGCLKHFICGGAPLDEEVEVAFQCMGMPILQGYGLTETSPIVSVNTRKSHRVGSAGKPLPGVNVKISEDGEITVNGPNVMRGYYKDPDATSAVLRDGVFHTGDIGRLDADGFLYVTGRKKNVIVTAGGKNVYPEEIEATVGRSPYISDICIVACKDKVGEEPFAFVIPDYDQFGKCDLGRDDVTVEEVIRNELKRLSAVLPDHTRISSFVIFKGEFPRTTTRKIKRSELAQITPDRLRAAHGPGAMDESAARLRNLVARVCELSEEEIALNSDLYMDLGVDSLMKVEILAAIEAEFDVAIPDEVSHRISSFGELVDMVEEYGEERVGQHFVLEERPESYEFLKDRSFLRNFMKRYLALFFRVFSRWYFELEVDGLNYLEGLQSFIITPNHNSLLDVPIVLSSLPRRVAEKVFSPAAKDYFFDRHPFRRWFITLVFDAFPFDRHGNFMKALNRCKYTIEQGKSLILFPEGTRSMDGELLPFKTGLAALALKLGIPIVPTYVKGIHEAFGKGMLFPRPNKIEVRFGEPLLMDRYESRQPASRKYDIYREIVEDVRREMLELVRNAHVR